MILNVDLIYAEFLEHFLAVVQDEEAINVSTLASGFLRSEVLSTTIEKLSNNHSYIPLSAVKKAGLVDQHGTILTSQENPRSARVKLYVDKIRTLAVLKQLGVDHEKLTEVQQLVLVTCCQEAINRVITGPFRAFSQNVSQISNPLHQVKIIEVIQHMSIVTLGGIAAQLNFNANDTSLSPETILRIKRRRSQFIEMAESNPGIEIPIEIFVDEIFFSNHRISHSMDFVQFDTIDWKCFKNIFKRNTVIGFFPHLLGKIQMTFWTLEIWIHSKRKGTIDNKFCGIKERKQKFYCMTLVVCHICPVFQIFSEWDFVWKPCIAHGLIVQIVCPFLSHWVK